MNSKFDRKLTLSIPKVVCDLIFKESLDLCGPNSGKLRTLILIWKQTRKNPMIQFKKHECFHALLVSSWHLQFMYRQSIKTTLTHSTLRMHPLRNSITQASLSRLNKLVNGLNPGYQLLVCCDRPVEVVFRKTMLLLVTPTTVFLKTTFTRTITTNQ